MPRRGHGELEPLGSARARLLAAARPIAAVELVSAEDALGRVLAESVLARASVPHYAGAAMDGIAVRSEDTALATEDRPATLRRGHPDSQQRPFQWVDTGNPLPAWANAVVMVERVHAGGAPVVDASAEVVQVRAPSARWQHVRLVGEDVVASEPLLPRGHRVRPWDVGALLAAGVEEVPVRPRPVVAVLPTGDELIEPGEERRPGGVVEFNSRMIAAFVREWGGEPARLARAGDDPEELRRRIDEALDDADVVCVIAGSSEGRRDFTVDALASLGDVLTHGIDVMPGKPASVMASGPSHSGGPRRASVAIGVPGYPVSAAIVCRELLEPLLAHLVSAARPDRTTVRAVLPQGLASRSGREEFVRVTVGRVAGRLLASPLPRGAGAITTLARADGLVRVPSPVEEIAPGEEVDVELLRPLDDLEETIVAAGAVDPALSVLEDLLLSGRPRRRLSLRAAGSAAALAALGRGEAHLAVTRHLAGARLPVRADAASLAGDAPAVVVHLAAREVGVVLPRGSAGGRRDEETPGGAPADDEPPLRAAVAVASGLVEAASGVRSAAAALGLDFLPAAREDLDLVLRADFAESASGRALVAAVRSSAFREGLARIPGVDASRTGDSKPR